IGSGRETAIGEIVKFVKDITGKDVTVEQEEARKRPVESEVGRLVCDNRKAKKLAGWAPRYTLEEGLSETIAWFKKNLHLYKPDIYNV
ncbi:MAG: NAD-dependent dehydratase, partial [Firmicutes bacterium]|nr:NAD-dependent dehydratase [Bacillota bacterium]